MEVGLETTQGVYVYAGNVQIINGIEGYVMNMEYACVRGGWLHIIN